MHLDQLILHQKLFSIYGCFLTAHVYVHFSADTAVLLVITSDKNIILIVSVNHLYVK